MDKDLSYLIRVYYGLSTAEPTAGQLERILGDVDRLYFVEGRTPSLEKLGELVRLHCPTAGTEGMRAEVSIDLRVALQRLKAKRVSK